MGRWIAVAVAGLLLVACSADEPASAPDAVEEPEVEPEEPLDADGGLGFQSAALSGGEQPATAPDAEQPIEEQLPPLPDGVPPPTGERVIKEGTMTVEVGEDEFDAAYARVIDAAARLGGMVIASTSRSIEDGGTSGSITVRVPVEAYEDLLTSVGGIGTVRHRQITAQDVTTEYVDLQSRLRHLEAQEAFYLGLMDRAEVVGDAIAVHQHLNGIQEQMEQVKGRIQYLDARTSFSTLTVELYEPGADTLVVEDEEDRPTLAAYWERARDAFVNAVGGLLIAGMFLAPLLIPALLALAVWRATRRPAGA
jgi:hypothetical protein